MKVQTQWVVIPTLLITLEHEWRRVTISSEEAFEVLDKYLSAGSHVFKYVLKDGSILDIFHTNRPDRDAALNRLFTEYLPELWAEFGHRAQPFTPVEPWLPGILEQLCKSLTYIGTVSQTGEIKLPKRLRAEVGKAFAGKDVIVTFARPKKTRSSEQNRYYWGVVVRMVCEGFQALGNPVNPDSVEDAELVHTYLKRRFLEPIQVADVNGEVHELGYSTTQLSTSQMMDYIAQVQQFAVEFLNVIIPDPGEQAELWTH